AARREADGTQLAASLHPLEGGNGDAASNAAASRRGINLRPFVSGISHSGWPERCPKNEDNRPGAERLRRPADRQLSLCDRRQKPLPYSVFVSVAPGMGAPSRSLGDPH